MYAVIRTAASSTGFAGDVVKIESVSSENQTVEFSDVLAVQATREQWPGRRARK